MIIPGLAGFYAKMEPIAYTITRIVFGAIMMVMGPDRVGTAFANNYGVPSWFAYLAILFEVFGGAALVLGLFTRFFAAALAIELLIAMFAAHFAKGFAVGGGGYEYVMFLGFIAFYIAIRGAGPYSADAKIGKHL
ncbi:MAG: DoxX family protein [Hyphomicrobiales bacterium]|nr:DoxX family protein [Hyphomicrobiales bacterium]